MCVFCCRMKSNASKIERIHQTHCYFIKFKVVELLSVEPTIFAFHTSLKCHVINMRLKTNHSFVYNSICIFMEEEKKKLFDSHLITTTNVKCFVTACKRRHINALRVDAGRLLSPISLYLRITLRSS